MYIKKGFAVRVVMKQAREEGMKTAVHWQDSDSSSAKPITECFLEPKIMICGGHASKAHLKVFEKYSQVETASAVFSKVNGTKASSLK